MGKHSVVRQVVGDDATDAAQGASRNVRDVGHSLTHASDWQADGDVAKYWDHLVHPEKPPVDTTSAGPAPDIGQTNIGAASQQLQQERNMRSSWSMLTGGQGILDDAHTMSPQLLGS